MTDGPIPQQAQLPQEIYAVFAGGIDTVAVQKLSNAIALAHGSGVKHAHLIFQTTGGIIADGVCLYNILRASPVEITLYNVGSVASVGVVAFLGAKHRKSTANATFMVHRSYSSPLQATSERLQAAARSLILDDERVENILKQHITLPSENWEAHKAADVWLSAQEAHSAKIIDEIADFAPPKGAPFFYVGPNV